MTGLFSAISGQFTKALILGALFPAAVFVLLWLMFVAPLLPPGFALSPPQVLGADGGALSVTFATLVLTGLLYNLDTPLIQLFEGYPWQGSLLGRWRTGVHRKRLERLRRRVGVLYELMSQEGVPEYDRLSSAWSHAREKLATDYPESPELVLPTRLGNVTRAFERYPSVRYGMESIYFWPRLLAVIHPDYAAPIGDARTSLVFLLNLALLMFALCAATVAAGLVYLPPDPLIHVALPALGFLLASGWLYGRSLGAAATWGELVKGAFDLYRGKLLEQLGYGQSPRTRVEERALWGAIGLQGIYGDQQVGLHEYAARLDYADPEPAPHAVRGEPEDVELQLSRGVRTPGWRGEMRVVVSVANLDAERTATGVVVTDTPPEGTAYVWDSAQCDGRRVQAVGTGPYEFQLGDVEPETASLLTYSVYPIDRQRGG